MDFRFTKEQEMLQREIRKFAEEKLEPIAAEVDELDEVSWEVVRLLAEQELFCLLTPEEYGGVGPTATSICIAREELSRVSGHADLLFAETGLCAFPIRTFGSEEQKEKYLTAFSKGEAIGCYALTEPDAGSDVSGMQTTAVLDGDQYVLNGTKCFASVGPFAQTYVTYAKTEPDQGARGISAFIIEKGTPGFDGKPMKLMGPHPIGELTFNDCRIPKGNLIGEPNKGMRIAMTTLDKNRKAFGKTIAEFQNTQFKLADMATELDAARLLVYRASWMRDEVSERVTKEASMAKLYATEMAWRVVDQALQIHGGYGVLRGSTTERLYREIRQPRVYEGTSEIQRLVISRHILGN
ncbi:MAG: acyl-CoA dehydrogenase family protein [Deltaproteobacteria bacterium]|nr:acyl-CoA dehydrogenase family protein [Deltaproteobacteria bacterium]